MFFGMMVKSGSADITTGLRLGLGIGLRLGLGLSVGIGLGLRIELNGYINRLQPNYVLRHPQSTFYP